MSSSIEMRLLVCLLMAITTGVVVRGKSAGPNAVATINGQTMLDCTTNNLASSNWRHSPDGNSNFITIASGCIVTENNAAYYRTELIGDNICRLITANATMQQAGVYNCYDGGSSVYRSLVTVIDPFARVVVYNQSEVVEGDHLNISCSINYNGPASPAPSLRPSPYWTTTPGQIFIISVYHPSTNVATVAATVTVQKYTVPVYQCNTVFEITGNTSGYNSTAPADSFAVGSTKEIVVEYPVETITIHSTVPSEDSCVSEPETLTCTANADPPAQYVWTDLKNNITTTGAVMSISSGGEFQCIASNSIRNQTHNQTKSVTEISCSESSLVWLTILIWPVVGCILGCLFLIIYIKKKSTYNSHFPFLEKMLPCMNTDVNATYFERCGWIILYILMVTIVGVFIIPIMFMKVEFCSSTRVYLDNVKMIGPEIDAPHPKETIVDEKVNEENAVKKEKTKKKKKKVTDSSKRKEKIP